MSATPVPATSSPLLASLFRPREGALPVIDPQLKHLGRFWIDLRKIIKTHGLCRFQANHPHPPSLCLLYQEGRCNAGGKCNQIHVKRSHMKNLHKALNALDCANCCSVHGDIASGRQDIRSFLSAHTIEVSMADGRTFVVPSESIAITNYWERFLLTDTPPSTISIPNFRICNLHQQHQCRYGVDCRNVHICREFWATSFASHEEAAAFMSSLADMEMSSEDEELQVEALAFNLLTEPAAAAELPSNEDCAPEIPVQAEPTHPACLMWDQIESPSQISPLSDLRGAPGAGEPLGLRSESMDTLTSPVTPLSRLLSSFARVLYGADPRQECRLDAYLQASQPLVGEVEPGDAQQPAKPVAQLTTEGRRRYPIAGKDLHRLLPAEIPREPQPDRAVASRSPHAMFVPRDPEVRRPKALRSIPTGHAVWTRKDLFGVAAPSVPSSGGRIGF